MVAQIRSEAQAIAELAHPGNRNRLLRDDSIARHADAILALTGDTKEFSDAYMQMSAEESGIASATGDTEEAT